jgi:hypothetical protein
MREHFADCEGKNMGETITIQVKSHTRTVRHREVHFTCQLCSGDYTVQQHLGRPPRYCARCRQDLERWRRQDDRDAAADRMRRLRDARRAAQSPPPPDRSRQKVGH